MSNALAVKLYIHSMAKWRGKLTSKLQFHCRPRQHHTLPGLQFYLRERQINIPGLQLQFHRRNWPSDHRLLQVPLVEINSGNVPEGQNVNNGQLDESKSTCETADVLGFWSAKLKVEGLADNCATPWNQSNVLRPLHCGGGLDLPRWKLKVVQAGGIVIVMGRHVPRRERDD